MQMVPILNQTPTLQLAQRRASVMFQMGGPLKYRKSITGSDSSHGNKQKVQLENTYQLDPKDGELFVSYKVYIYIASYNVYIY